ncbi:MAG: T9SS type A sorting domain-containing protein [Saprospiraceae bacterium]
MKWIFFILILFITLQIQSQVFFSRVYTVPEDGTGKLNVWPNYLRAVFPTDSLIYAFGYSADTTYKQIDGTGFFVFNTQGDLLEYYHIKDSDQYNFFYPEGIHTWDGVTFYTAFNNFYREESILKFNRLTKQQEVLEIKNSKINNGDILRSNMIATNDGCLVTASDVAIDSTGYNYKIQITKIDTTGKIKWQTIVGKEPGNTFNNNCLSSYTDDFGNIYAGIGFRDAGVGWKASYQSLLYKLDFDGNIKKFYGSQLAREGFCSIYDIAQDKNGWFYLSSNYNLNEPQYPYANYGHGVIQILDTSLNYKSYINLNYDTTFTSPASLKTFEKIINSNDNNGFIVGGLVVKDDSIITYIDSFSRFDTSIITHYVVTIFKINNNNQIVWRRYFRIRNGYDHGWLHDLKSFPGGGYLIGAQSFDGLAESFNKPYHLPWLLKVDDDGCLIPGCDIVGNKDLESKNEIVIYPNPASNYIILHHSSAEKTHYQIVSAEGKIIDDFYSYLPDEQIIIPMYNYKSGTYFVKAENKKGSSSRLFIKQ